MEDLTRAHGWRPDLSAFGARLALVRQRMGWNVKEAADHCRLPPQSWRSWEAGRTPRDLVAVCQRIAETTGADVAWLLGLPDDSASGVHHAA
jgi:transcriptional regulator with XRE-family HTH domain